MQGPVKILSTKILSATSLQSVAGEDCRIDVVPFIRIEHICPGRMSGDKGSVTAIFTSVQGLKGYLALDEANRPAVKAVYCIAGATKRAVHEDLPGIPVIASRPYASELVQDIIRLHDASMASLYFYCGDQRMPTVPEGLSAAGIAFTEQVVYHTIACPVKVDVPYDGILFFSPSAVHSFFSLNVLPEQAIVFAIGHTTAAVLQQYTDRVATAPETDEKVLLDYAIAYCKEIKK